MGFIEKDFHISRSYLFALLVFLSGGLVFFFNLGLCELGRAEGRIAEVVREMLLRGDYLHPTCLFMPYVTKPIIPYWFVIGIYKARGILDEFTLRLPVALSVILSALSTYFLAKRLFGLKIALASALIFLTSYGVITWGKIAAPDMLNVFFIILSVTLYWFIREQEKPFWYFLLGVLIALSGHMKGLVGVVIPLLLIVIDVIYKRRFSIFFRPKIIGPFLFGLLFYFIPFFLSSMTGPNQGYNWITMALHESLTRAIRPFDHRGSPFMYLEFLPIWMLPWTPLFLSSIFIFLKGLKGLPYEAKWLGVSILAIFLLFTVAGSRRSYYILPILPFCAIFTGMLFDSSLPFKESLVKRAIGLQGAFFLFFALSLCLLASYGLIGRTFPLKEDFLRAVLVHGLLLLVGTFLIFYFLKKERASSLIFSLLFTGYILTAGFILVEKSHFDKFSTERTFVKGLKAIQKSLPNTIKFSYYHMGTRTRARLSFYLNEKEPIPNLTKIKREEAKDLVLISEREDFEILLRDLKRYNMDYRILLKQEVPWWLGWPNRQKKELRHQLLCVLIKG